MHNRGDTMTDHTEQQRHMTVEQAITFLSKITNKKMALMIDCPFCGKGSQISFIDEAVILGSEGGE